MNILLGITGSVAATLSDKIVLGFRHDDPGNKVKVVVTRPAVHFFPKARGPGIGGVPVLGEVDEWEWKKVGDPILHIVLRDWMDVMVVAPLSANTLGKMANGICDNLLTSVWLASGGKPVVVAPAMNTQMWLHPAVRRNTKALREMGVVVVDPVEKQLACGETGVGAMAPIEAVMAAAVRAACAR